MLLRTVLSDMAAAPGSMLDDARADGRGEQTPHMRGDDAGDSGSDAASELRALERSEPKLEVRVSASSSVSGGALELEATEDNDDSAPISEEGLRRSRLELLREQRLTARAIDARLRLNQEPNCASPPVE